MKQTWTLMALVATLLASGFFQQIQAQKTDPKDAGELEDRYITGGGIGSGIAEALGLSKEKAAEVKNRMHENRKRLLQLKSERDIIKADIEHLMSADPIDEKAIALATEKLAASSAVFTKAQIQARTDVMQLLTHEQRTKLVELRKTAREKRNKERAAGLSDLDSSEHLRPAKPVGNVP